MPLVETDDITIYFAHCPKAGGTSIEAHLSERFGEVMLYERGWEAYWRAEGWRAPRYPASPQHLAWDEVQAFLPSPPDHVFAVVRDPLKRLISEHQFQARWNPHPWRVRNHLTRLGFSTWMRIMICAMQIDRNIMDNHIRPQSDIVPGHAKVFRLEDGLAPLVSWLDETAPASRRINGIGHEQKSKAKVRPPVLRRQDLELIARVYRSDYEAFGYTPPAPDEAPADLLAPLRSALAVVLGPVVVWLFNRGKI